MGYTVMVCSVESAQPDAPAVMTSLSWYVASLVLDELVSVSVGFCALEMRVPSRNH